MRKLSVISLVLLLAAGVAYAKDYEVSKKAGDYDVLVTIDRNPPATGDNNLTISVKDKAGKPVMDAKVKVDYTMPPMPGMPPMNYKTDAALRGDTYKATMNLSMAGPWNITVKIMRDNKTERVKFTIDAK